MNLCAIEREFDLNGGVEVSEMKGAGVYCLLIVDMVSLCSQIPSTDNQACFD